MAKYASKGNDLHVEQALAAIAAYPRASEAQEFLKAQGIEMSPSTIKKYKYEYYDRLAEIRKQLAPRIEATLADDMLDNARLATEVERLAIERTQELLDSGMCQDPSRVARDLSQIRTQAVDKRLALEGRPTQITAHRDIDEVVRSLESMKVIKQVEA
jgi:hypothetical protein